MVAARAPSDGAFGRLLLALEWQHVRLVDTESFQVAVAASARCPGQEVERVSFEKGC